MARSRSFLPLVLVAALVAAVGLFWFVSGAGSEGVAEVPVFSAAPIDVPQEEARPEAAELTAPKEPSSGTFGEPEVANGDEGNDEAREAATSAADEELARAHWVEGRVVFPIDAPQGEVVKVWADGNSFEHRDEHEVEVGPDGRFRVAFSEKTKRGRLRLKSRWLYLDRIDSFKVREHEGLIVLEPRVGGRVEGVVRAPAGAAEDALAEAEVDLRGRPTDPTSFTWSRESAEVTDDGTFAFEAVRADREWTLGAKAAGFAPFQKHGVAVVPGETTRVEADLTPGVSLTGVLLDGAGAPVADARVRAISSRLESGQARTIREDCITDADGRFEIRGVPAGSIRLEATGPTIVEVAEALGVLEDGDERRDLVLTASRGRSISGVVLWADGTPAAGAKVTLVERIARGSASFRYYDQEETDTEAAADGSFSFEGLGEDEVALHASAVPGGAGAKPANKGLLEAALKKGVEAIEDGRGQAADAAWTARVDEVVPGTAGLVLTLAAGATITGTVRDDTGAPLEEFQIELRQKGNDFGDWRFGSDVRRQGFEGARGAFRVEGVADGHWEVRAVADGHTPGRATSLEVPGDLRPIDLVVVRAARVSGRVLAPDGTPAADARVEVRQASNPYVFGFPGEDSERADADGYFTIEDAPAGPAGLTASKQGFAASEVVEIDVKPGGAASDLVLTLTVPGRIAGRFAPKDGSSPAGRQVQLQSPAIRVWTQTHCDDAGEFSFEGLTAGRYTLVVGPSEDRLEETLGEDGKVDWAKRQSLSIQTTAEVVAGETTHVVIGEASADSVLVHGRITRGGEPLRDARLWAHDGRSTAIQGSSDAGGSYELRVPGPGDYNIGVRPKDSGVYVNRSVEVPAGERLRVDFELPAGRLAGRLEDPAGEPIVGVFVMVSKNRGGDEGGPSTNGNQTTDEEGRFDFDGLAPGTYTVQCGGSQGWARTTGPAYGLWRRDDVEIVEGAPVELAIELEVGATLEGRVSDAAGEPVGGATLFLHREDGTVDTNWGRNQTDGAGRFEVGGIAQGTYTVTARTGQLVSEPTGPVTVAAGDRRSIDVVVREGALIVVRSTRADGSPAKPRLTVRDAEGHQFHAMWSGRPGPSVEGERRFGPVPPGTYTVVAEEGEQRLERTVEVTAATSDSVVELAFE